ncbi:hypothetical protein [Nostoc sp.]
MKKSRPVVMSGFYKVIDRGIKCASFLQLRGTFLLTVADNFV